MSVPIVEIPIIVFISNLVLSALLAFLLGKLYEKYGTTLSNRAVFGQNFLIITMTTMLIISIVKSSLALSLGLVGALSIIRFRAAIKEPEELAYLFLAISIGLGLGASQTKITLLAFLIISMILITKKIFEKNTKPNSNLFITISNNKKEINSEKIIEILQNHCSYVSLKRFDDNNNNFEISFIAEFNSFSEINKVRESLYKLDSNYNISFLDNSKLY
tara:strand:- start:2704 stop:3357 length:654 start_codon:yes stop_codon:yes gene_type:complete